MTRFADSDARAPEWLGLALLALAAGLAANSLLGPLLAGVIDYPLSHTLLNQTLGLDTASLVVAAPLAAAAGWLGLRDHPAAPVLALPPALYVAYMFVQYLVGPDYLRFPGVLSFHLGLFVLSEVVAVRAWAASDSRWLERASPRSDRALGGILLALAAFVVLRYVPALLGSLEGRPLPAESRRDPAMFWTIFLLDLGVVVPAAVAAATNLFRSGAAWARTAGHALVGWFALVGIAVAAMGGSMQMNDDPHASMATTLLFALGGLVSLILALWFFLPLFTRRSGDGGGG